MLLVVVTSLLVASNNDVLAVAELDAPPNMLGLAMQVAQATLAEAERQQMSALSPSDLRERLGVKAFNELVKCTGAASCLSEPLKPLAVTKVVLGRLERDDKNYVVSMRLVDLETSKVLTTFNRSILIASRRFIKDVEAAMPALLRGEKEVEGSVTIKALTRGREVNNAQVFLNEELIGTTPVTRQLKPGKYLVRVEKLKHLPITRWVNVELGQTLEEEFRLLLMPGIAPEDVVEKSAPAAKAPKVVTTTSRTGSTTERL